MGLFKSAAAVASINFRRWLKDIKVRIVFIFIAVLVYFYLSPYTSYGLASGHSCSPCVLPLLFQSGNMSVNLPKTLLHVGMLLLLCDAPFFSPVSPYMILRSKRRGWWLGECFYIVGAALVYTLFITLVSVLVLLPIAEWSNDWGSLEYEIVFGDGVRSGLEVAIEQRMQIAPLGDIIRYLYPIGTQLYVFAAIWMSFSVLGLLMYTVSLLKRSMVLGMCTAGILIFLDPLLVRLAMGAEGYWIELFSPVCWTSIDQFQEANRFLFMNIPLAMILYIVLIVLLFIAAWRVSRKAVIEVRT